MGVKTAMLVCGDVETDLAAALAGAADGADAEGASALVSLLYPPHRVRPDGDDPWELAEAVYPPEGHTCALSTPDVDVICDRAFMIDRPSLLPEHLVAASTGRRLVLHAMHSVVDWFAFAVWEDGELVRALSVAPDDGILEDLGERLPFEEPYWAGSFPVAADRGEAYPLPFHPLELGERALYEFFGFAFEGFDGDEEVEWRVDPEDVLLFGFEVA